MKQIEEEEEEERVEYRLQGILENARVKRGETFIVIYLSKGIGNAGILCVLLFMLAVFERLGTRLAC